MRNEGVTLCSNKFLFRILVPLVFILSLIQPTIANGETFIWPVNQSHTISQDYAVYNDGRPNKYHTGIDLYTDNLEVYVAASGWVHDIKRDIDDWGNAIILRHQSGEYSVYAHLEKFSEIFTKDQWLPSLTKLGKMGETGAVDGIHLHFAIKSNGSWGVGYTQDIPDGYDYGFRDPKVYISPFSAMSINPVAVKIVIPLSVFTGPDTTYSEMTTVSLNQKFIAFGKSGNWYQIYLPNANGFTSGWIAAISSGITYAVEDPSAIRIEVQNVGLSGLKIRSGPGESFPEIKVKNWDINVKIWDNQRFVTFENINNWYHFYLPASAGASDGWSYDDPENDYLNIIPGFKGDLNGDGTVNSIDWSIMNMNWGTSNPVADINGDGIVNTIDWSIMNANWGKSE